jgi:hypothetical protein
MAKKKKTTVPIAPPPGSYDPNLDAAARASKRGLGYVRDDTTTQRVRNTTDLATALQQIGTQRGYNQEDYGTATGAENTGYDRSLADLLQGRTREGEDYQTNLQNLSRQYQQLGDVQAQAANKAGVLSGGASAQAARKRTANQAIDKAPIDTAHQRFLADSTTDQTRLGEDHQTRLGGLLTQFKRSGDALDFQQGQTGLTYQRAGEDLTTQLGRAKDENTFFQQDTAAARQAQYGGPVLTTTRTAQTGGQQHPSAVGAALAAGSLIAGKRKKGRTV